MWESIKAATAAEPIATVGFTLTWAAALFGGWQKRKRHLENEKERMHDLVNDAKTTLNRARYEFHRVKHYADSVMESLDPTNPGVTLLSNALDGLASAITTDKELHRRIATFNYDDTSHKNFMLAKELHSRATRILNSMQSASELTVELSTNKQTNSS